MNTPVIGFIGQGWIGKNYADDFESRGYEVVRYGLEEPYRANKEALASCEIVFIAVPTPTTLEGFDVSAVRSALSLVTPGAIAVIKSSLIPGMTDTLHKEMPHLRILHSPEFLREKTAAYDAAHPERTIIGIPEETPDYREAADMVFAVLPPSPYTRIMSARAAELVKYAGNVFLMTKVVYANLLFDLAHNLDIEYESIQDALGADPRIGPSHLQPVLPSGHNELPGRGAGGHCFIKDFEAFRQFYAAFGEDPLGSMVLTSIAKKNNALLRKSEKDLDLLESVYGKEDSLRT